MNRFHLGLLLCALSAACNVDGLIAIALPDPPPVFVGVASGVLALATLAGVLLAWSERRGGTALVIVSRLVWAAVIALPSYFLDAPPWVLATVSAGLALAAAGIGLAWTGRQARATG
ncbi:hypothetical protein [Actinomadura macrotermitis]|uniref:Lipoprotein n=1 Tax=Actinomadura macrotermitis TaxID=2585200 RepID=A0A7K0BUI2_9ACTN|nr:hypothetical protein [Actinomadura macrotermitis]MQY04811.1 hypothetical protein [Actinomadura macrotermitis]